MAVDLNLLLSDFKSSLKVEIGTSDFARVYRFQNYAIKVIDEAADEARTRWLDREGIIGPLIRHPNIVVLHGRGVGEFKNSIVMDCVGDGDLSDLCTFFHFTLNEINDPAERVRRMSNTQLLMRQIRSALAYLHENRYLYRDLKGENIRVVINEGKLEKAVLVDLGSVRHADTDDGLPPKEGSTKLRARRYTLCGTLISMSPEMLNGNGKYTNKTDCWSLGALLHYLFLEVYPLEAHSQSKTLELPKTDCWSLGALLHSLFLKVYPLEERPQSKTLELPKSAADLIDKLLDPNPDTRPSMKEIETHNFFTEVLDNHS